MPRRSCKTAKRNYACCERKMPLVHRKFKAAMNGWVVQGHKLLRGKCVVIDANTLKSTRALLAAKAKDVLAVNYADEDGRFRRECAKLGVPAFVGELGEALRTPDLLPSVIYADAMDAKCDYMLDTLEPTLRGAAARALCLYTVVQRQQHAPLERLLQAMLHCARSQGFEPLAGWARACDAVRREAKVYTVALGRGLTEAQRRGLAEAAADFRLAPLPSPPSSVYSSEASVVDNIQRLRSERLPLRGGFWERLRRNLRALRPTAQRRCLSALDVDARAAFRRWAATSRSQPCRSPEEQRASDAKHWAGVKAHLLSLRPAARIYVEFDGRRREELRCLGAQQSGGVSAEDLTPAVRAAITRGDRSPESEDSVARLPTKADVLVVVAEGRRDPATAEGHWRAVLKALRKDGVLVWAARLPTGLTAAHEFLQTTACLGRLGLLPVPRPRELWAAKDGSAWFTELYRR